VHPLAMAVALGVGWTCFGFSVARRWRLLSIGVPDGHFRFDRATERLRRVWDQAFAARKLRSYPLAGLAHQIIFFGFLVLLARTLMLWGRGFDPSFDLWILGPEPLFGRVPLGNFYAFGKDVCSLLVLAGVAVFFHLRVLRRESRMTLSAEGLLILALIAAMMTGDLLYDGAQLARSGVTTWRAYPEIGGSLFALALTGAGELTLSRLEQVGFWTHVLLVLVFLNLLPYSKHFHVITAIPNLFFSDLAPAGRLPPLTNGSEALMDRIDEASELDDPSEIGIGVSRLPHFGRAALLDLFTCTECGRCSERCPAFLTGKKLNPKQLTLDLRDFLYASAGKDRTDLVPNVVEPDVIWACTTCRACEQECPVGITYVDKIIQLRRPLVMVRGEQFPTELTKSFEAMESNGNPWGLSALDRMAWADGLDVPTMAERPSAEVLYWVGCAAAYDARARKISRAFVQLLKAAGVDFAVLGTEESCTGDAARRAGNEFLYLALAEQNIATLETYRKRGGVRRIVTTCPHCFNTLANEYPDLGGHFLVVHHTQLLSELLRERRLVPEEPLSQPVAYHDSCYLARYNRIYDAPRDVLRRLPGVELREVPDATGQRGLCCGAGGAQMWMEEQNQDRVNVKRTLQLVDTGSPVVASSCPFCMTMLTDGLKALERDEDVEACDVAELLARACALSE
jgi:Fe-S oxidoreductase